MIGLDGGLTHGIGLAGEGHEVVGGDAVAIKPLPGGVETTHRTVLERAGSRPLHGGGLGCECVVGVRHCIAVKGRDRRAVGMASML